MLTWLRSRARTFGATVLLSFVVLGASSAHPHDDDCHDACSSYVEHDASAHRFQSGTANAQSSHPLHCLVCHWARSFRPHVEAAFLPAPAAERQARVPVVVVAARGSIVAAQPPLRSPPSVVA